MPRDWKRGSDGFGEISADQGRDGGARSLGRAVGGARALALSVAASDCRFPQVSHSLDSIDQEAAPRPSFGRSPTADFSERRVVARRYSALLSDMIDRALLLLPRRCRGLHHDTGREAPHLRETVLAGFGCLLHLIWRNIDAVRCELSASSPSTGCRHASRPPRAGRRVR